MKNNKLNDVHNHIERAIMALSQVAGVNEELNDAKTHLLTAIRKVEAYRDKKHITHKSQATQAEHWWKNVVSGTAKLANSPIATQMTLDHLNSIIEEETTKLDDLEKQSNTNELITE